MDFSTMRSKVERNFYPTIDEFLSDFQLVCDNARLYNAKETLYWRQADKLWDWGSRAIERERKTILDRDEEVLRTVKDEETLDVGGMGDYSGNSGNGGGGTANGLQSRGSFMSVEPAVDVSDYDIYQVAEVETYRCNLNAGWIMMMYVVMLSRLLSNH
ncbi:MAG: hypothetical protein JOS17DRAFT_733991 [Linnemannia elongata]|nr:MAG: hypothetical protein JOS17DRAFT_733991 [Linnemannia elongata]